MAKRKGIRSDKKTSAQRRNLKFEALEPRILLSADMGIPMPLDDDGKVEAPDSIIIDVEPIDPVYDSKPIIEGLDEDIVLPESLQLQAEEEEEERQAATENATSDDALPEASSDETSAEPAELSAEQVVAYQQIAEAQFSSLNQELLASSQSDSTQLIVVDSAVEDYDQLIHSVLLSLGEPDSVQPSNQSADGSNPEESRSSLLSDDQWQTLQRYAQEGSDEGLMLKGESGVDIVILSGQLDGIDQITDILKDYQGLAAIHLLSHGSSANLRLGNSQLNNQSLSQRGDQIKGWGKSLTEQGDVLLYGCEVAQGALGVEMIDSLAALTSADVAASNDITGADGDWDLEYQSGEVDYAIYNQLALQSYQHSLELDNTIPGFEDTFESFKDQLMAAFEPLNQVAQKLNGMTLPAELAALGPEQFGLVLAELQNVFAVSGAIQTTLDSAVAPTIDDFIGLVQTQLDTLVADSPFSGIMSLTGGYDSLGQELRFNLAVDLQKNTVAAVDADDAAALAGSFVGGLDGLTGSDYFANIAGDALSGFELPFDASSEFGFGVAIAMDLDFGISLAELLGQDIPDPTTLAADDYFIGWNQVEANLELTADNLYVDLIPGGAAELGVSGADLRLSANAALALSGVDAQQRLQLDSFGIGSISASNTAAFNGTLPITAGLANVGNLGSLGTPLIVIDDKALGDGLVGVELDFKFNKEFKDTIKSLFTNLDTSGLDMGELGLSLPDLPLDFSGIDFLADALGPLQSVIDSLFSFDQFGIIIEDFYNLFSGLDLLSNIEGLSLDLSTDWSSLDWNASFGLADFTAFKDEFLGVLQAIKPSVDWNALTLEADFMDAFVAINVNDLMTAFSTQLQTLLDIDAPTLTGYSFNDLLAQLDSVVGQVPTLQSLGNYLQEMLPAASGADLSLGGLNLSAAFDSVAKEFRLDFDLGLEQLLEDVLSTDNQAELQAQLQQLLAGLGDSDWLAKLGLPVDQLSGMQLGLPQLESLPAFDLFASLNLEFGLGVSLTDFLSNPVGGISSSDMFVQLGDLSGEFKLSSNDLEGVVSLLNQGDSYLNLTLLEGGYIAVSASMDGRLNNPVKQRVNVTELTAMDDYFEWDNIAQFAAALPFNLTGDIAGLGIDDVLDQVYALGTPLVTLNAEITNGGDTDSEIDFDFVLGDDFRAQIKGMIQALAGNLPATPSIALPDISLPSFDLPFGLADLGLDGIFNSLQSLVDIDAITGLMDNFLDLYEGIELLELLAVPDVDFALIDWSQYESILHRLLPDVAIDFSLPDFNFDYELYLPRLTFADLMAEFDFDISNLLGELPNTFADLKVQLADIMGGLPTMSGLGQYLSALLPAQLNLNFTAGPVEIEVVYSQESKELRIEFDAMFQQALAQITLNDIAAGLSTSLQGALEALNDFGLGGLVDPDSLTLGDINLPDGLLIDAIGELFFDGALVLQLADFMQNPLSGDIGLDDIVFELNEVGADVQLDLTGLATDIQLLPTDGELALQLLDDAFLSLPIMVRGAVDSTVFARNQAQISQLGTLFGSIDWTSDSKVGFELFMPFTVAGTQVTALGLDAITGLGTPAIWIKDPSLGDEIDDVNNIDSVFDTTNVYLDFIIADSLEDTLRDAFTSLGDSITGAVNDLDFSDLGLTALEPIVQGAFGPLQGIADMGDLVADYLSLARAFSFDFTTELPALGTALSLSGGDFDATDTDHLAQLAQTLNAEFGLTIETLTTDSISEYRAEIYDLLNADFQLTSYLTQLSELVGAVDANDFNSIREDVFNWFSDLVTVQGLVDFVTSLMPDAFGADEGGLSFEVDLKAKQVGLGLNLSPSFKQTLGDFETLMGELMGGATDQLAGLLGLDIGDVSQFVPDALEGIELLGKLDLNIFSNIDLSDLGSFSALDDITVKVSEFAADLTLQGEDLDFGVDLGAVTAAVVDGSIFWNIHAELSSLISDTAVSLSTFINDVKNAKPVFEYLEEDLDGDGQFDPKQNYFALNLPIDIDIDLFNTELDIGDLAKPVLSVTDSFQWLGSGDPANDGINPTVALDLSIDVGAILQEPVQALVDQIVALGFVDYSLPLLNQSLESLIGVKSYLEGIVTSVSSLASLDVTFSKTAGQPAEITVDDTLFNQIEAAFEQALGLAQGAVNFAYVNNQIEVDVDFKMDIDESFDVEIDLKDLVASSPVQIMAAAQFAVAGAANFGLHFRYDLVNKLKKNNGIDGGLSLISDETAGKVTGFQLILDEFGITDFDALAGIQLPDLPDGLGLDVFEDLLGSLEDAAQVSIKDGSASLLKMNTAGDAALPLVDFTYDETNGWQSPELNLDFNLILPVFIADGIKLTDPIQVLGGLKEGVSGFSASNFEFTPPVLPDPSTIINQVKMMALINSPGFIIGALEDMFSAEDGGDGLFGKMKSYVTDGMSNLNLPLVSGAVDTLSGIATDFGDMIDQLFGDFANDLLASMASIGLDSNTTMIDLIQKGLYELFVKLGDLLASAGINIGNPLLNLNDPLDTASTDPAHYIVLLDEKLAEGKLEFAFRMGGMLVDEDFELDFEAGVPGISLDIVNTPLHLAAELGMDVGFGFDVTATSLTEFAYLATDKGVDWDNDGADDLEEFGIKFTASLPSLEAYASLGFLAANMKGFDADDTDSITDPVYLNAYFVGDLMDNGDGDDLLYFNELSGQIEVAVGLDSHASMRIKAGIGDLGEVDTSVIHQEFGDVLLGMGADFNFDQSFKKILNGDNAGVIGSLNPDVGFDNVYMDLSGLIDGFIGDIADEIGKVTGPLQPIVDTLTNPLELLLELGVDEKDASLLGMSKFILGATNPKYVSAIKFIEAIGQVISFVNTVQEFREANDGGLIIDLGSFKIGSDDDGNAAVDDSTVVAKDLDAELNSSKNTSKKGSTQSKNLVNEMSAGAFEFPLLTNPKEAFKLLMGTEDVTLFKYDMPDLDFSFDYVKSFPIFTGLNARFGGEVTATTNFDFGFDTAGLNDWRNGVGDFTAWDLTKLADGDVGEAFGFNDNDPVAFMEDIGTALLGGFYLDDHVTFDEFGNVIEDIPEVELTAKIIAGASLGVGGLVEAGVEGDVTATIGLDLNDKPKNPSSPDKTGDGKVRLEEFLQRLEHGPQCLFDMSGELSAGLNAFLWIGLDLGFSEITLVDETIELFRAVIADFEIGCGDIDPPIVAMNSAPTFNADNPTAVTAEGEKLYLQDVSAGLTGSAADDGVLVLNTGDRASYRGQHMIDGSPEPGEYWYNTDPLVKEAERFAVVQKRVELLDGSMLDFVRVSYNGYYRDYVGVTEIHADMGDGRDQLTFDMDKGAQDDPDATQINVHFKGGTEDDGIFYAGSGSAIIEGGEGNDTLVGGNQSDTITGNAGNDRIKGNDGDDFLYGTSGNNVIYGGLGRDIIDGGTGDDQIFGDTGKTLTGLVAEEHIDTIDGGSGKDFIRGDVGADIIDGGQGTDTIDWTIGDDSDQLVGGESTQTVYIDNLEDRNILTEESGIPTGNKLPPSLDVLGVEGSYYAIMESPDTLVVHVDDEDKNTRFEFSPNASNPEDVDLVIHQAELGETINTAGIPLASLAISRFEKIRIEGSEGKEQFVINDLTGTSLYGLDLELGRGEQLDKVLATESLEIVDVVDGISAARTIKVQTVFDGHDPAASNMEIADTFYKVEPFFYRPAATAVGGTGEELEYLVDNNGSPLLVEIDIEGEAFWVQQVKRGTVLVDIEAELTSVDELIQTRFFDGIGEAELIAEYNNDGTPVITTIMLDGVPVEVQSVVGGLPTITSMDQLSAVSTQYEYISHQVEKPVFADVDGFDEPQAVYGYDDAGDPITDASDPAVAVQAVRDQAGNDRTTDGDGVYAYDDVSGRAIIKNNTGDFVYVNADPASPEELVAAGDQTRLGLGVGSVVLTDSFGLDIFINGSYSQLILGFDIDDDGNPLAIVDRANTNVLPPQLVDVFIDPIYGLDSNADTVTVYGTDTGDTFEIYSEEDPTQFLAADVEGAAKGLSTQVVVSQLGGVAIAVRQANDINDTVTVNAFTQAAESQQLGSTFAADADVIDASATESGILNTLVINSGQGDDIVIGSQGADAIDSGYGDDQVTGNAGVDSFTDAGGTDTLIESRDLDLTLLGNYFIVGELVGESYDVYHAGAEVESIVNDDDSEIFEKADINGGYSRNTLVVNDDDGTINVLVDGGGSATEYNDLIMWRGEASLDNLSNIGDEQLEERYVVFLSGGLQATTGIVTIDDSGKALEDAIDANDQLVGGIDYLYLLGTSGQEYVYLGNIETGNGTDLGMGVGYRQIGQGGSEGDADYAYASSKADNPDNGGIDSKNLPFSTAIIYDERMERLVVDSSGGKDQFLLDDNRVITDIYMGSGADTIVVGSVPTTINNSGIPVVDESRLTSGVSAVTNIYGNGGNDSFEINHNAATLWLYGNNGDDEFVLNSFLVERILGPDEEPPQLGMQGGGGENSYNLTVDETSDVDQTVYDYLQNANVIIDGGEGTDTIVFNGTPISDDFVITDNFVAGVGRFVTFVNIERVKIQGGGDDDNIYVLATRADLEVEISGGTGADTIHMGGDNIPINLDPPEYQFVPDAILTQDADPIYEIFESGNYETTQTVTTWERVYFSHYEDGSAWYNWYYPYNTSSLKNSLIRADITYQIGDGYRGTTLDKWQGGEVLYRTNGIEPLTASGQEGFAELGSSNYNSILYSVGVSDWSSSLTEWDNKAYDKHTYAKITTTYTYQVPSFDYFLEDEYKYRGYVATPVTPVWVDPAAYQVKLDRVDDVSNRFYGKLIIDGGDSEGDDDRFVFHNEDGSVTSGSLDTLYDVQQRENGAIDGALLWEGGDVERIERTELAGAGIGISSVPAAIDEVWMLALQGSIDAGDNWSIRIDGVDYAAASGATLAEQLANTVKGISGLDADFEDDVVLVWAGDTASTLALSIQVITTDTDINREPITEQKAGNALLDNDVIVNSAMNLSGFGIDSGSVEIRNIEDLDLRLNDTTGPSDQLIVNDTLAINIDVALGAGDDEVTVLGNKATLNIFGGAGNDTVTLGDGTSDLSAIEGAIDFKGDWHREEIADTSQAIQRIDVLNIDSNGVPIDELVALNPGQTGYFATDVAVFDGVGNESYNSLNEIETDMGRTVYNDSQTEAQHGNAIKIDDGAGKLRPVLWSELNQTSIQNAIRSTYGQATLDRVMALDAIYGADYNGEHGFQVQKTQFSTTETDYRPFVVVESEAAAGNDQLIINHNDASGGQGESTATNITGLGMGVGVSFDKVEQLDISLGVGDDKFVVSSTHSRDIAFRNANPAVKVNAGAGSDEIKVNAISDLTTVITGAGVDEVIVAEASLMLSGIQADLTIEGSTSNSTDRVTLLNNADTGDATDDNKRDGVLTDNTVEKLGMGGDINYADIDELNIFLGEAHDQFIVDSTHTGLTNVFGFGGDDAFGVGDINGDTTIDAGFGADTVNIQGTAAGLDSIQATLSLIGGSDSLNGEDQVIIDLSPSTSALDGTLTGDQPGVNGGLAGLGMLGGFIDMSSGSGWEYLSLTMGALADRLTVNGNNAARTSINMDPSGTDKSGKAIGAVDDHLIIEQMNHQIDALGGVGEDLFDIYSSQPAAEGDSAQLNVDGGEQNDTYNFYFSGNSGLLVNQTNTGLERGQDVATVYGTDEADFIHLYTEGYDIPTDFGSGTYVPEGTVTVGLDSAREQLAYSGIENLTVDAGKGNDQVLADGAAVPATILLGEGDDNFTIGTVFLEDPDQDGIRSVDESVLTPGNWTTMRVEGGIGNDTFEVNHNKSDLYLFGQEDDDTFIVNTFQVVRVDGGTGNNVYKYLQNGAVIIDGGSGIDTLVVNGTDSDDVFVVHKDFIVGGGRWISYQNVERILINGGNGDDQIYVLSTSIDVETIVDGGAGNDEIHIGGDHPVIEIDPPQQLVSQQPFDITYDVPVFGWVAQNPMAPFTVTGWKDFYNAIYSASGYLYSLKFLGYDQSGQIRVEMAFVPYPVYEQVATDQRTVTVTPPPVVVDQPAYDFKYEGVNDLTGIQGKLLIEAGEDAADTNDQVIVHNEAGTVAEGAFVAVQEFAKDDLETDWVENAATLYETSEYSRQSNGDLHLTLFGAYQSGESWWINIGGEKYSADVTGADMSDVVSALTDAINLGGIYSAEANGTQLILSGVQAIPTYQIAAATTYDSGRVTSKIRTFTDTGVGKDYVELQGLGLGSGVAVDGDAFAGIRIDASMDTVELRLGDVSNDITFETSVSGTTDVILAGGDDQVAVKGIDGAVNLLGGAGDDQVAVHNDGNTLESIAAKLTFSGDAHRFEQIDSSETQAVAGFDPTTGKVAESLVQLEVQKTDDAGNLLYLTDLGVETLESTNNSPLIVPVYLDAQGFQTFEDTIVRLDGVVVAAQKVMVPSTVLTDKVITTSSSIQTTSIDGTDTLVVVNTGTDDPVNMTLSESSLVGEFDQSGDTRAIDYDGVDLLRVRLAGGDDEVRVSGTSARTYIDSGEGDDAFTLSGETQSLEQFSGDLIIEAGLGNNSLAVDDVNDQSGDSVELNRADALFSSAERSVLEVGDHFVVRGLAEADIIYTATGGDFSEGLSIQAGAGADDIQVNDIYAADHTEINAGAGADDVTVNDFDVNGRSPSLNIDGDAGDDVIDASNSPIRIDMQGSADNDTLIGSQFDDGISGGEGDDIAMGGLGDDSIAGDQGSDWLIGGEASVTDADGNQANARNREEARLLESTNGTGLDIIAGGEGDDILIGGGGNDQLFGGSGDDIVIGDSGTVTLSANGSKRIDSSDTSTGGNDVIDAGDGENSIIAGMGDDTIVSGSGNDAVLADAGVITVSIAGGQAVSQSDNNTGGNDQVSTGSGDDLVIAGGGDDTVDGGAGDDILIGDQGRAEWTGLQASWKFVEAEDLLPKEGGFDQLSGSDGDDVLIGGAKDDRLLGGAGDDLISGDGGKVAYRDGNRYQFGTTNFFIGGEDFLQGDEGRDVLLGGAKSDEFVGTLEDDLIIFEYGRITFDPNSTNEDITAVVRLAQGRQDLASSELFSLYASLADNATSFSPQRIVEGRSSDSEAVSAVESSQTFSNVLSSNPATGSGGVQFASVDNTNDIDAILSLPPTEAGEPIDQSGTSTPVEQELPNETAPAPGATEPVDAVPTESNEKANEFEPMPYMGFPNSVTESENNNDSNAGKAALALAALGGWKMAGGRNRAEYRVSNKDLDSLEMTANKRRFMRWENGELVNNDQVKGKIKHIK